jgi:PcaR/PcaU/PobR family beta-ketoadipate pathway transcriptional regulator
MLPYNRINFRYMEDSSKGFNQGPVGSLERGLAILKVFNAQRHELGMTEIASEIGLGLSTVHRLLNSLVQLGYLVRDPVSKRFRPSLQVLQLGFAALEGLELRQVALPVLRTLSESLNGNVNCGVLDGPEVVYVIRLARAQLITTTFYEGSRLSAHCGSMGKCLLAYLPQQTRQEIFSRIHFVAHTPYTITDPEQLELECQKIRIQGFATLDQELAIGHRGVAAPVFNASGEAIAAINVALPASTVTPQELVESWAGRLIQTANQITLAMGGRLPSAKTYS